MNLKNRESVIEKTGRSIGFVFVYLVFTTIFYYVFYFLKKLPKSWGYLHIMLITFLIMMIGIGLKRWLSTK